MAKNIAITVLGVIVLILSILGISKYKKNNSIDIGFGIGNIGIGSGRYKEDGGGKSKTKKGNFVECSENSGEGLSATMYVEFKNNKLSNKIVQYKMVGIVPEEEMKKTTKEYLEYRLMSYTCANDQNDALCGNVKFSWSGNTVTATFAINIEESYKKYYGLSQDEFISVITKNSSNATCKKVSKAPIYGTSLDPAGTYYRKYLNYKDNNNSNVSAVKENNNVNTKDIKSARLLSAQSRASQFIDVIEYEINVSDSGEKNVQLPINNKGVTCIKTNGAWDNTCKSFMSSVESKAKGKIPDSATIIIDANGSVKANTKLSYYGYQCTFNGNIINCK